MMNYGREKGPHHDPGAAMWRNIINTSYVYCVPPQSREIDPGDPNADVFKILQLTELLGIWHNHNGVPNIFS